MSDNKYDQLIAGHDYDGIEELDNPLPRWWLFIFWGTIVFGIGYYAYYEMMGGPSLSAELAREMKTIEAQRSQAESQQPKKEDIDLNAILASSEKMSLGAKQYQQKCAACHGDKGQGMIGPNLTDNYWIHGGGDLKGIIEVVEKGVLDKGMPPWKGVIPGDEIIYLSAYIKNMKGSNPPGAKAPQGELIEQ